MSSIKWNTRYARSWEEAIARDRDRIEKQELDIAYRSDGAEVARALIGVPPTVSPERPSDLGDYYVEGGKIEIVGGIIANPLLAFTALFSCGSDGSSEYRSQAIDTYHGYDSGEALPDPATVDNDGDGFCEAEECSDGSKPGDCNDVSPAIFPGNFDFCDGIDNNCNEQVDEFGCGSLILEEDSNLVRTLNLQTVSIGTLYEHEDTEERLAFSAVSPDGETLAFSSFGGRKIYLMDLPTRSLKKIEGVSFWSKFGWFDNNRLAGSIYCAPCGFSHDDPRDIVEVKMHFVTREGDVSIVRPEMRIEESALDVYNHRIIWFDLNTNDVFVYKKEDGDLGATNRLIEGVLNDGMSEDYRSGAAWISRANSNLAYFTRRKPGSADGLYISGELIKYIIPFEELEVLMDLGEYRRGSGMTVQGIFPYADEERLLVYRQDIEDQITLCSVLPPTRDREAEEACLIRGKVNFPLFDEYLRIHYTHLSL